MGNPAPVCGGQGPRIRLLTYATITLSALIYLGFGLKAALDTVTLPDPVQLQNFPNVSLSSVKKTDANFLQS